VEAAMLMPACCLNIQRFSDACDLKYFISAIFHIIQRFPDARSFSIAPLLKLKLELSALDARR
jgi:hypothetical protein